MPLPAALNSTKHSTGQLWVVAMHTAKLLSHGICLRPARHQTRGHALKRMRKHDETGVGKTAGCKRIGTDAPGPGAAGLHTDTHLAALGQGRRQPPSLPHPAHQQGSRAPPRALRRTGRGGLAYGHAAGHPNQPRSVLAGWGAAAAAGNQSQSEGAEQRPLAAPRGVHGVAVWQRKAAADSAALVADKKSYAGEHQSGRKSAGAAAQGGAARCCRKHRSHGRQPVHRCLSPTASLNGVIELHDVAQQASHACQLLLLPLPEGTDTGSCNHHAHPATAVLTPGCSSCCGGPEVVTVASATGTCAVPKSSEPEHRSPSLPRRTLPSPWPDTALRCGTSELESAAEPRLAVSFPLGRPDEPPAERPESCCRSRTEPLPVSIAWVQARQQQRKHSVSPSADDVGQHEVGTSGHAVAYAAACPVPARA